MSTPRDEALNRLCSLDDATRRRLYDHVARQAEPVSRDDASEVLDLDRSTVAYHLDKLVEQGLLAASFARPEGVGGPGAGRPAKHYARVEEEFGVSVPPRDYRLAAELLARAVEMDTDGAVRDALDRAAAEFGRELSDAADETEDLVAYLERQGFEPFEDGDTIRLRNCPFHRLAREHTELICGMNLSMLSGALSALDASYEARLDPAPDRCCVAFEPKRG